MDEYYIFSDGTQFGPDVAHGVPPSETCTCGMWESTSATPLVFWTFIAGKLQAMGEGEELRIEKHYAR